MTEGVVRLPSLLAITTGSLPSNTATQEFVVPKSIPIIFPIIFRFFYFLLNWLMFSLTDIQMACQMGLRRFFADKRRCAVSDRMTLGAVLVTVLHY